MDIVWREGKYKYRTASIAHINNVRVAAVSWVTSSKCYNVHCLLPGMKWAPRNINDAASARLSAEEQIKKWFEVVLK